MDSLKVKPHERDQSNKVPTNKAKNWFPVSCISSKRQPLHSLQIIHITQCGTKFQIFEECFPNQFICTANKSITFLGKTQATPNNLRAGLHNWETSSQCNKRLSTLHNWEMERPFSLNNHLLESFSTQLSNKERHSTWDLHTPNAFPWKRSRVRSAQSTIKRLSKSPFSFNPHLILTPYSFGGFSDSKAGPHQFHFPIVKTTLKPYIPTPLFLHRMTLKPQMKIWLSLFFPSVTEYHAKLRLSVWNKKLIPQSKNEYLFFQGFVRWDQHSTSSGKMTTCWYTTVIKCISVTLVPTTLKQIRITWRDRGE